MVLKNDSVDKRAPMFFLIQESDKCVKSWRQFAHVLRESLKYASPNLLMMREEDYSFLMALRAEVTSAAALRVAATHHLFDRLLHVGSLVSRYLLPAIIPPAFPVGNEDLAESVATLLCRRMKQQGCRCSIGGDDQHPLAGVNVRDRFHRNMHVIL